MRHEPRADNMEPTADERLAAAWRAHRRRVLDVSYRMLGTLADAEEAVQETYVRLVRHGTVTIDDVEGWLITVAGRVCIDRLRADRARHTYIGPWLPEPLVERAGEGVDPADQVTLDDTVRMALLVVLEQLSPPQRTAFVLHDVFGLTFEQVAEAVGRSPAACRKLASRARHTIQHDTEPRCAVTALAARAVVERFSRACASGEFDALVAALDPDVVGEFDSGGHIAGAPLGPLVGAHLVAATLVRTLAGSSATFHTATVNNQPGLLVKLHEQVMAVITIETDGCRIHAVRAIGNPAKLTHLQC